MESVTATTLQRGQLPDRVVGFGSCAPRWGGERVATPVQTDSPACGTRAAPSAVLALKPRDETQLGRGAVVVDGEAQASPTFPVELSQYTAPRDLTLVVSRLGLSLGPTRQRVRFRCYFVSGWSSPRPCCGLYLLFAREEFEGAGDSREVHRIHHP